MVKWRVCRPEGKYNGKSGRVAGAKIGEVDYLDYV